MPKITYLHKTEKPNTCGDELIATVRYYQSLRNLTQGEVAKKVSITPQTFSNRVKNPKQMTLEELVHIFDAMHFTSDDILRVFGRGSKSPTAGERSDVAYGTYGV